MQFSVLLSVYKKEKTEYLRQTLDSIVQQTVMPSEIVVVKDGPLTAELDACLEEYSNNYPQLFQFVTLEKNVGLGMALKTGIEACQYEYIARMDTDDIALPDRFALQIAYLEAHPEVDLLGSWIENFSENPNVVDNVTKLPCSQEDITKYAKSRNPFRHMTVIYKKVAVLEIGNYHDFPGFEDYDLWIRFLQKGFVVANLPEYLVKVRADASFYGRRGGLDYLAKDIDFQLKVYKSGFISFPTLAKNIFVRTIVRLIPNGLRVFVYNKLLRDKVN